MNISAANNTTDSTQIQQSAETNTNANAEKTSAAAKTEDKKEEKTQEQKGEFQKVLEEQKSTDKISIEQEQLLQNQNVQVDEQFAQKFGFDTVSSLKGLKCSMNYDTVKISQEDAKFFTDLVDNKHFALQQNGDKANLIKFADEIGPTYKMIQTSNVLTDLISKAYNDQKPVRIDFDNNVSVILKIDTKGKVSAEFIPGDKAVEAYLRNNIGFLKQRFDDQNLSYNDLLYRQSNQNGQRRNNQQRNKGE